MAVPHEFQPDECLTAQELNENFEWLCNQLNLQPDVVEALQAAINGVQSQLLEKCAAIEARLDALENP